jgi:hypothetical protein
MTTTNKVLTIVILLASVVIIILAFLFGEHNFKFHEAMNNPVVTITVRDTIYSNKIDTFKVGFPVVKTIYKEKIDTITITQAFEKSIDTTFIDSSRLQVVYMFPQDTFKIKLQTRIKEIFQKDTIKTYIEIPKQKDYTTPLIYGGSGLILGIIVGVLIAR